jgi:hypothetical protein
MEPDQNAFHLEQTSELGDQQPVGVTTSPDSASALRTRISFAPGVAEKIGSYVYLLIDPRTNAVFYVGKGTGDRSFAHLAEAEKSLAEEIEENAKLARIREIESSGEAVKIAILRHGMSDREAFLVEATVIDLLPNLVNVQAGHNSDEFGHRSVSEIDVKYGARPVKIDPRHCVVLIRINRLFERGMTDDALYEATRKWWVIGGARQQLGDPGAPQWAMAVYGGIVRAVYRIEAWERPTDDDIAANPSDSDRWGFRGERDLGMEAKYLHGDVSSYLRAADTGHALQNPIRYVNCAESRQGFARCSPE